MTEAQTDTLPTVGLSQANSDRLKKFYTFRDPERVVRFLEKHPFLVPLLLEAVIDPKIKHYFPGDELLLEAVIDLEAASLIVTNIELEESVEKLWELDKNWWLKASGKSRNKLEISLG